MQRLMNILLSMILITFLIAGDAMALTLISVSDLGKEITVNDGIASRGSQLGTHGEDDEGEFFTEIHKSFIPPTADT